MPKSAKVMTYTIFGCIRQTEGRNHTAIFNLQMRVRQDVSDTTNFKQVSEVQTCRGCENFEWGSNISTDKQSIFDLIKWAWHRVESCGSLRLIAVHQSSDFVRIRLNSDQKCQCKVSPSAQY